MKRRTIVLGAVIGLIVGAIVMPALVTMYANSYPSIRYGENILAIPVCGGLIIIGSTAAGAWIGFIIAYYRAKGKGHGS